MAAPVLLLAAIPFVGNYRHASRRTHTLARAWAIDVLLSVEPYGILISNGDNDTFPLWYAQEVEGVHRDVRVVLAPYLKSDWYARQLRILRVRAYRDDGLPEYRALVGPTPRTGPLTLSDAEADAVPQQQPLGNAREFISGKIHATLRADTITRDQALVLQLIRDVFPRRSIYFTVGQYAQELGLGDYIATQGLVQRLLEQPAHTDPRLVAFPGGHLDVERTRALWARYRGQHDLLDESARVDAMPSGIPVVYNVTMQLLAYGLAQQGDALRPLVGTDPLTGAEIGGSRARGEPRHDGRERGHHQECQHEQHRADDRGRDRPPCLNARRFDHQVIRRVRGILNGIAQPAATDDHLGETQHQQHDDPRHDHPGGVTTHHDD
jgi:hypothetical protein